MKIRSIRVVGLRGGASKGGWNNELQLEDSVHSLVFVDTDECLVGVGSVFSNAALVSAVVRDYLRKFIRNGKNDATLKKVQPSFSPSLGENDGIFFSTWNFGITNILVFSYKQQLLP